MLTKSDLTAIQKMFDSSRKETNLRFSNIDKKFVAIDKKFNSINRRFDGMDKRLDGVDKRLDGIDKKIDNLSKGLQNTTEELVELITNGFESNEERFGRLESEVFKSN